MTYAAWLLVIGVLCGTYTAGMATVLAGQWLRELVAVYPPDWEPGQAYDRGHVADCVRCGCTANEHDKGWRCPQTIKFRLNRWLSRGRYR